MDRRRLLAAVAVVGLAVVTLVVAGVLLAESDSTTTTAGGPPVISPTTSARPDPLDAFPTTTVVVSGQVWEVAVADEHHERTRGLMFVTDLGHLDGMLFVWEEDSVDPFWMENTPLPLDVATFTADGILVDVFSMDPCTVAPCPHYESAAPYRYALEAPRGAFEAMDRPSLDLGER